MYIKKYSFYAVGEFTKVGGDQSGASARQKWTSRPAAVCPPPLTLQSYHWTAAMQSKGHNDWTARGRPNLLCTYARHGCLEDVQIQDGGSFKQRDLRSLQPRNLPRLYSPATDAFEQINK